MSAGPRVQPNVIGCPSSSAHRGRAAARELQLLALHAFICLRTRRPAYAGDGLGEAALHHRGRAFPGRTRAADAGGSAAPPVLRRRVRLTGTETSAVARPFAFLVVTDVHAGMTGHGPRGRARGKDNYLPQASREDGLATPVGGSDVRSSKRETPSRAPLSEINGPATSWRSLEYLAPLARAPICQRRSSRLMTRQPARVRARPRIRVRTPSLPCGCGTWRLRHPGLHGNALRVAVQDVPECSGSICRSVDDCRSVRIRCARGIARCVPLRLRGDRQSACPPRLGTRESRNTVHPGARATYLSRRGGVARVRRERFRNEMSSASPIAVPAESLVRVSDAVGAEDRELTATSGSEGALFPIVVRRRASAAHRRYVSARPLSPPLGAMILAVGSRTPSRDRLRDSRVPTPRADRTCLRARRRIERGRAPARPCHPSRTTRPTAARGRGSRCRWMSSRRDYRPRAVGESSTPGAAARPSRIGTRTPRPSGATGAAPDRG